MSVDGEWDVVVKSPMGAQKTVVALKTDGDTVTGTEIGTGNQVKDGKIDGNQVSWAFDVTTPVKMRVEMVFKLTDDKLEGTAKAGMFGKFPASATKRS
jgi:hypothetical protein